MRAQQLLQNVTLLYYDCKQQLLNITSYYLGDSDFPMRQLSNQLSVRSCHESGGD